MTIPKNKKEIYVINSKIVWINSLFNEPKALPKAIAIPWLQSEPKATPIKIVYVFILEEKDKTKNNKGKKTKKANDAPKGGLGKKVKEIFSELKKVSWPSFKSVVKNTGVVIVVVLVFTVVLFGIDRGLAALYNLIPR